MADDLEPILLTFGGGINANRRSLDIEPSECTEGENFDLDPDVAIFRRRSPFDLVGTAPNNQPIRGFAQLSNRDGTTSTLIQAGPNVYDWNGSGSFTLVGMVNASSRIRGDRTSSDLLNQYVIITDLEKLTVVKKWDGTNFQDFAHNLAQPFFAKHCTVHGERAWFGNVQSGTDTPHVILASGLSDSENLTVANRPSSALSAADPFFFHTLDLRPVNGLAESFGVFIISSQNGSLQRLTGGDATDYALIDFYDNADVAGNEATVNIGNTLIIGAPGRIEALVGTEAFGNVNSTDMSLWINPVIERFDAWTLAYNRRLQKVYCFPEDENECWVLHKNILGSGLSPWAKWTTDHGFDFLPVTVMPIKNPVTGLDEVYCGDSSGRIFLLEGEGDHDGGTENIATFRTSGALRVPMADVFDLTGYVIYERLFEATLTLTFLWQGVVVEDQPISITLPGAFDQAFYNEEFYYGGDVYYGFPFAGRLSLRDFARAGLSSLIQVKAEIDGATDFAIHEIGIQLHAAER